MKFEKSENLSNFFLIFESFTEKNGQFSSIFTGSSLMNLNIYHNKVLSNKIFHTLELTINLNEVILNSSLTEQNYKLMKNAKYIYFLSKSSSVMKDECLFKIDIYFCKQNDNYKQFNDCIVVSFNLY